ncbi:MAG TPA: ComEC/Rec2 family competence protein, partial [Bacteroidales bacterium]|nr:ComEC/Rec2 family competence protein [Bacteroidales bacterium]
EADITISGYYRFTVEPLEIHSGHSVPLAHDDRWQVIVEPADSIELLPAREGNIVCFKTELSGHSAPTNPVSFDYGKYLFRQGISGTGFVKKDNFKVLPGGGLHGVLGQIKEMRHQTRQVYQENGIEGEELQVLSALTLGMRHELDDEVKERFVHSGAIHVLAVSGLHVGIVFIFLNLLLNTFLPARSFIRMLIVVAVLTFFALLTGAAPSVFRAVVMLSVIQVGNYFNRNGNIYNLLGISAFIILLVQPLSLYHAGFWLSHLAVAGIVTFYPIFRRFYAGGNIFVRGIGDLAAVSLSAQLGTFPLSIYLFRAFPSWFLLTNFLILPLVAPILVLTKLLVAFSGIPFVASMISGLLVEMLGFMLGMVEWLDTLPAAYIQGLWMAPLTMVLLYLFIGSIMIWESTRLRMFFKLSLLCLLGVVIMFNYDYWAKRTTNALVVFDTG